MSIFRLSLIHISAGRKRREHLNKQDIDGIHQGYSRHSGFPHARDHDGIRHADRNSQQPVSYTHLGDADAVRREGVNFILAAFLHQGENIPHVLLAERFAAVNEMCIRDSPKGRAVAQPEKALSA